MTQIPPREDLQVIVGLQRLASREVVVVVVRTEFGDEMSHGRKLLQTRGRLSAETGRSNSGLKNRLARAAKKIGVKPTTAP